MSEEFEALVGPVPGMHTAELRGRLRTSESRNVTYLGEDFPVFWESARGATIVDVDGNRYLDLTAAFGVANVGHANPQVAAAIADQAARLMHGMGDVHPTASRAQLLERLSAVLPTGLTKAFLATTGSEAVEAAMKTAILATGKSAFAAFRGAYHGLSFGTLAIGGIEKFRAPFADAIRRDALLLDFPGAGNDDADAALLRAERALRAREDLAALIVEPIQARGGCILPPIGYLRGLRALCDELGILMIVDEIYTGFGRTGAWFACLHEEVTPDIICIGKAMGGGFPISAAVAKPAIMDAWPLTAGEALHTSTYLGNPMGCAAALATMSELERMALPARALALGEMMGERLAAMQSHEGVIDARGRGAMWGLELRDGDLAERTVKRALRGGVIALQAGPTGNVISVTPPLTITDAQLHRALDILEASLL